MVLRRLNHVLRGLLCKQVFAAAVAFDDSHSTWVRAPMYRLAPGLLLSVARSSVLAKDKQLHDLSLPLQTARKSVEVTAS